jgi:hypothetical protein
MSQSKAGGGPRPPPVSDDDFQKAALARKATWRAAYERAIAGASHASDPPMSARWKDSAARGDTLPSPILAGGAVGSHEDSFFSRSRSFSLSGSRSIDVEAGETDAAACCCGGSEPKADSATKAQVASASSRGARLATKTQTLRGGGPVAATVLGEVAMLDDCSLSECATASTSHTHASDSSGAPSATEACTGRAAVPPFQGATVRHPASRRHGVKLPSALQLLQAAGPAGGIAVKLET